MLIPCPSLVLLFPPALVRASISYAIPVSTPSGAASLEPAPLSVSFEFSAFPSYFNNVPGTSQCLLSFQALAGTWPSIRISGNSQDRATYVPSTTAEVVYTVASPTDTPSNLTFGKSFISLAATYPGSVVLGLNRGYNNISSTIEASKFAVEKIGNLLAIEFGAEPENYWVDSQPITHNSGSWTPVIDAKSEDH